jgi:hypothetical protein
MPATLQRKTVRGLGKDAYVHFSMEDFCSTLKFWLHFFTVSTPCGERKREVVPMAGSLVMAPLCLPKTGKSHSQNTGTWEKAFSKKKLSCLIHQVC